MVLKLKTRIIILIFLIASLGLCFYFYSSEEKRSVENELYFNMYQGMKKSCRGIIKNEEFKRSEGERYREGDTTVRFNDEDYEVEIVFINNVSEQTIFFIIYKNSLLSDNTWKTSQNKKYYLGYNVKTGNLIKETLENPRIPDELQRVFEQEMKERLKSC